ncbi:hypothetical protein BKA57DRAFT_434623 [Linnemannia elongata]|nr:hypothetical protein BKA57DRAFT_434623 [Linnemannia elongata]
MHPQFSYGVGNNYTNEFDIRATATPSTIPPILNQTDSPRASSSSISSPHLSATTISTPIQSSTSASHLPNDLSPNHLFLSSMARNQPHNHYQQQGLQQQPNLPQSDFPLYPTPLEQSTYPPQLPAAEPPNKGFLAHFNPVSFETISPAQDYLMASSFDAEEVPQGWLWDAYQQAAMDSMLLDRTPRREQHFLPLVHTPGLSSSHSTVSPSGLYPGDTFWHSNALELASRAAELASASLMNIATTAPAFATNGITGSSSSYHTMGSSSSSMTVPSSSTYLPPLGSCGRAEVME